MTARITLYALLVSLIGIGPIFGQYYPQQTGQQNPPVAGQQPRQQYPQIGPQRPTYPANQPTAPAQGAYRGTPGQPMPPGASAMVPQNTPTLQRRAPQTVNAPFQLTAAQQAEVDSFLKQWEEVSQKHKRTKIQFNRFEYKPAWTPTPNTPLHVDRGEADFASSGKWMWRIHGEIVDQKLVDGQRTELMVFDGKSIHEYKYSEKTVIQHVLGEGMKGEDMVRAMLPFLFGTDMKTLKDRYFIRLLQRSNPQEVCIAAFPRFREEAQNFKEARMIVDLAKMEPTGLMLILPIGKEYYAYEFTNVQINPRNPLDLINDPFKFKVPSGWKTYVEQMPGPQMSNRPATGPTRQ